MKEPDEHDALRTARRLMDRGNVDAARHILQEAALARPESATAQAALGDVLREAGRYGEAASCYEAALLRDPQHPGGRVGLAWCLARRPSLAGRLEDDRLVADLLADDSLDPALVARAAALVVRASPDPLDHPLLPLLLERTMVTDLELERVLVDHRRRLCLDPPQEPDKLAHALAGQGQLNEFAWSVSAEEASALDTAPAWVRALYGAPAHDPDIARRAALLPSISPVRGTTSTAVASQYEENPYPRWTSLPPHHPVSLDAYLNRLTRGAWPSFPARPWSRMLVAGCGTGREMLTAASMWQPDEVVGIDLSRTSLAYAQRMAERLDIPVELFHGDLIELGDLDHLGDRDRGFDVIVCTGVLHHLDDPIAGWRTLTRLLEPGGVMLIGLYSATARQGIAAAQAAVRDHGLPATAAGVRAARELVMDLPGAQSCRDLPDFFYLSGCRDLLLHVHECAFTIGEIRVALEALGLEFLGFDLEAAEHHRFATLFGRPDDLGSWEAYESLFPLTFLGMYQFWCRRQEVSETPAE